MGLRVIADWLAYLYRALFFMFHTRKCKRDSVLQEAVKERTKATEVSHGVDWCSYLLSRLYAPRSLGFRSA